MLIQSMMDSSHIAAQMDGPADLYVLLPKQAVP